MFIIIQIEALIDSPISHRYNEFSIHYYNIASCMVRDSRCAVIDLAFVNHQCFQQIRSETAAPPDNINDLPPRLSYHYNERM